MCLYPAVSDGGDEPCVGLMNSAPSAGSLVGRTSKRCLLGVSWLLLSKCVCRCFLFF